MTFLNKNDKNSFLNLCQLFQDYMKQVSTSFALINIQENYLTYKSIHRWIFPYLNQYYRTGVKTYYLQNEMFNIKLTSPQMSLIWFIKLTTFPQRSLICFIKLASPQRSLICLIKLTSPWTSPICFIKLYIFNLFGSSKLSNGDLPSVLSSCKEPKRLNIKNLIKQLKAVHGEVVKNHKD